MGKEIVMLHGASAGGWCFARFRHVLEGLGWTCHTPDLIGHGKSANAEELSLAGVSMVDYYSALKSFLETFRAPPVLLGHSMGAVLAQQLATLGLVRALVLVSPAPRAGILPQTDGERQLARNLMSLGQFWTTVIPPVFDLAKVYSLNRVPPEQQRDVFDRFIPESGQAFFETFFWMFDSASATAVDTGAIKCPVLCLSGTDDRFVSVATAQATVAPFRDATFWQAQGHGHMLPLEPGVEDIAHRVSEWIPD